MAATYVFSIIRNKCSFRQTSLLFSARVAETSAPKPHTRAEVGKSEHHSTFQPGSRLSLLAPRHVRVPLTVCARSRVERNSPTSSPRGLTLDPPLCCTAMYYIHRPNNTKMIIPLTFLCKLNSRAELDVGIQISLDQVTAEAFSWTVNVTC